MSVEISVFVILQQSDLHCISAYEALHRSMGFHELKSLRRFRHLKIRVSETESDPNHYCKKYIEAAFDLINPNKESVIYDQNLVAAHEGVYTIGIEVSHQNKALRHLSPASLLKFPAIESIEQTLLWALSVETKGLDDEMVVEKVSRLCGPTQSRAQGLLVNHLFETYSVFRLS